MTKLDRQFRRLFFHASAPETSVTPSISLGMWRVTIRFLAAAMALSAMFDSVYGGPIGPTELDREISISVTKLLSTRHLSQRPLDDEISRRFRPANSVLRWGPYPHSPYVGYSVNSALTSSEDNYGVFDSGGGDRSGIQWTYCDSGFLPTLSMLR